MMKKLKWMGYGASAFLILAMISACVQLGASEEVADNTASNTDSQLVQCSTPRPEICYELYQPVCAVRDNGVRCVTTPCPTIEKATYGNDCKACADPAVYGFQRGGDCSMLNTRGLDEQLQQWLNDSVTP